MAENKVFEINNQLGKLPPQAIEIEINVLGAMLLEKTHHHIVFDLLEPVFFYKSEHQKIFNALKLMYNENKPIDYSTIIQKLMDSGELEEVGGPGAVVSLSQKVGSSSHSEYHSKIIIQKYMAREMIRMSSEIQSMSYDDTTEVEDILISAGDQLFKIQNLVNTNEYNHISEVANEVIKENQKGHQYLKTGFKILDSAVHIEAPDLVILAARPSHGKTALGLLISSNIAISEPTAFFSLEMSKTQLGRRLMSKTAHLPHDYFLNKMYNENLEKLYNTVSEFEESKLFIDDTPALTIQKLRAKIMKMKLKHGIKCVVVDYLQLMSGVGNGRTEQVEYISNHLKGIAKEFNIAVIALAQLNRESVKNGFKRPGLTDLKNSGAIEQDADTVLFLLNYAMVKQTIDENGVPYDKGYCEIDCAKNRNGRTFEGAGIQFDGRYQNFIEKYENKDIIQEVDEFPEINDMEFTNTEF